MKTLYKLFFLALCAFASQAIQCTYKTRAEIINDLEFDAKALELRAKILELQVKALELQEKHDYLEAKAALQRCLLTKPNNYKTIQNYHDDCAQFVLTLATIAGAPETEKIIKSYTRDYSNSDLRKNTK